MKKFKNLMLLLIVPLFLSGCVKFNANMKINNDRSIDYSIIYAFQKSLVGDGNVVDDDQKREIEKQGFNLSEYNDETYKGVIISKKINNLDDESTDKDVEYSLSELAKESTDKKYMFKVTKGFLKNKYSAKFTFSTSDSNSSSESKEIDDEINNNDQVITNDTDGNFNIDNLSSSMKNMDLTYSVELPYKALSNNATNVENDGKKLSWNLVSTGKNTIEYEFELFNMTNVYILIGGGLAILSVAAVVIFMIMKKKNNIQVKED